MKPFRSANSTVISFFSERVETPCAMISSTTSAGAKCEKACCRDSRPRDATSSRRSSAATVRRLRRTWRSTIRTATVRMAQSIRGTALLHAVPARHARASSLLHSSGHLPIARPCRAGGTSPSSGRPGLCERRGTSPTRSRGKAARRCSSDSPSVASARTPVCSAPISPGSAAPGASKPSSPWPATGPCSVSRDGAGAGPSSSGPSRIRCCAR